MLGTTLTKDEVEEFMREADVVKSISMCKFETLTKLLIFV